MIKHCPTREDLSLSCKVQCCTLYSHGSQEFKHFANILWNHNIKVAEWVGEFQKFPTFSQLGIIFPEFRIQYSRIYLNPNQTRSVPKDKWEDYTWSGEAVSPKVGVHAQRMLQDLSPLKMTQLWMEQNQQGASYTLDPSQESPGCTKHWILSVFLARLMSRTGFLTFFSAKIKSCNNADGGGRRRFPETKRLNCFLFWRVWDLISNRRNPSCLPKPLGSKSDFSPSWYIRNLLLSSWLRNLLIRSYPNPNQYLDRG